MTAHGKNRPQEDRKPKDAAGIFIHHAKVYILADRYSIARLMDLSFHKLHQALVGYLDEGHRVEGIVGVLRFCCAGDAPEKLRQMMEHYAACNIKTLWGSEEFQELVEDCGSLSRDIIGRLIPRIAY
ncbi:hypothetical protein IMZ48_05155 [Candidatus Bathyarchaeota archaeon]|nr:hypothetical protein [Candidatus Bathyarchaeota archaeon]